MWRKELETGVSPPGLEPGTHSLKGCRSNQLSYGPSFGLENYTSSRHK